MYSEPNQKSKMECFAKKILHQKAVNYFWCMAGFWICFWIRYLFLLHQACVKWISFAITKTELLLSINLLLCTSSHVMAVVQHGCGANNAGKTKRTLHESCVEHTWSDQNIIVKNHLNQCVEMEYLLGITSLGSALFSDDINIWSTHNRNSCINDCYDYFNIPLCKEAVKINKIKPAINTSSKASKELQLLYGVSKHQVLISCN